MPTLNLTRAELLEACNTISVRWGGRHLGCVQGYRNQWLIAVELRDMEKMNATAAMISTMTGRRLEMDDLDEDYCWIRCGFCQTQIKRAPPGGFELRIPFEVLCRCRSSDHIVAYFETWIGRKAERERKREQWEEMVNQAQVEEDVPVDEENLARSFRVLKEMREVLEEQEERQEEVTVGTAATFV